MFITFKFANKCARWFQRRVLVAIFHNQSYLKGLDIYFKESVLGEEVKVNMFKIVVVFTLLNL